MRSPIQNRYEESFLEKTPTNAYGNIWGWKFSYFGLVLIVGMTLFLAWAHYTGRIDIRQSEPIVPTTAPAAIVDSVRQ